LALGLGLDLMSSSSVDIQRYWFRFSLSHCRSKKTEFTLYP